MGAQNGIMVLELEEEKTMNSPIATKATRLHIRTSASQKDLLSRAAHSRHLNVSQFVLQTCLEAAEKVVQEKQAQKDMEKDMDVVRVSAEHYDWLMQKLEEPPQDNAALRRLLAEAPVWNG